MTPVFQAHDFLSTCRTVNGHIPWTAVETYSRRHGIDLAFLEDTVYGIERIRSTIAKMREPANDEPG